MLLPPYDPNTVDPYTQTRVILMNGIEAESIIFSHQFHRHTDNPEIRRRLAMSRRVEQQQQKAVNWLLPGELSPLETTIGYEQVAVDLTSWLARHEPDPVLKQAPFTAAWGGIAGVQSTLAVLVEEGHHQRGLALSRIADLLAASPARRFRVPRKGAIAVGNDADLVLLDVGAPFVLEAGDLQQRHKTSPYVGRSFRGTIRRTVRRGQTIWRDGRITATSGGTLVRPGA